MLKYFTILTEINFIWLGGVSQVTQWSSLTPSFLSNCWKKPERNSGFDGIRTHFSFPVCTCATVYLQSLLRMKKAIIVKGTIIYNNSLSKMVFLLSIRQLLLLGETAGQLFRTRYRNHKTEQPVFWLIQIITPMLVTCLSSWDGKTKLPSRKYKEP